MNTENIEEIELTQYSGLVYAYTPMCGTCAVASKMLSVIEELIPNLVVVKMNVNYHRTLAESLMIESVPCLLIYKDGTLEHKLYAFQSVPFLYEKINQVLHSG
ncbi:thioredoxin family protein [Bacillus sp. DNRA2]|uniref:thioredoxin family protein n=1 Tax=Bacillus sp. DNRA2 TaxID=2723053 RepID=UPI00145D2779|nr:thioredoxin family protein [Bacillus sp. DNRA2]NMD68992.1 thioredoxin family protein [Bacillus sp. DNRA2]